MIKLKEITHKEFKELRYQQYIQQQQICPILKKYMQIDRGLSN